MRTFASLIFTLITFCASASAENIEKLADSKWLSLTSPNFEIVTDLDETTGVHLIEDLEAYRYFSIQIMHLNILTSLKPLKILAIGSNANFKKIGFPANWGGVFHLDKYGYSAIANVTGYKIDLNKNTFGRQVLFHEYNHFLVRFVQNSMNYPIWYDEGMAEYWGSFKFDGEKIYIGDPTAIKFRIADLINDYGNFNINSEKLFNTSNLLIYSTKDSDKAELSRFYAQSFFIIHYLNSSAELRSSLNNYLMYLNYGYREVDAFQKAFNTSHSEFDREAKKYLGSNLLMRVIGLKEGHIIFPKPDVVPRGLDSAEFYQKVSEILPAYLTGKEAVKKLLEKDITLNPGDTNAKMLLLINNLVNDPEKLIKEIELQSPQNPMLLTYQGDLLKDSANFLRKTGDASWVDTIKKARSYYRRAIKSDPLFPAAYFGLGDVYRFLPVTENLQEGAVGLDTATLYDRDGKSFSNYTDILIRMDKGLDILPSVRNTVAFSKEKEKSVYTLLEDNLELLKDTSEANAVKTATGLYFNDGTIYTGPIINNKPHGYGKVTRANGSYFEGNFVNGVMRDGKLVSCNGFIYDGEFQQGIAKGKGKIIYPEGSNKKSYEGDINYAFPHGHGKEITMSGVYDGEFWYGFYNGNGTYALSNGKALNGKWIQQQFVWPQINDETFIGFTDNQGERDGEGICINYTTSQNRHCIYRNGEPKPGN